MEDELKQVFKEYKTIWVQKTNSTESICVTLFPKNNTPYKIIIERWWCKDNKFDFESIKKLIERKLYES